MPRMNEEREDYEKFISEFEDATDQVMLATLTARLRAQLQSNQEEKEKEWMLEKLSNSPALVKMVDLLQVTENQQILGDILTIFDALSESKRGSTFSIVRPLLLWSVLIEVSLEVRIAVQTDHRYLALDILSRLFKNKTNTSMFCNDQTTQSRLVLDLLKMLESKEGSRKLMLKRHKSASTVLSSISRHKGGRQLIVEANVVERLYAFLLTLPNEKSRDTVFHKIGQTILRLRCVPLHDLFGMADTRSAFCYLPFGTVIESGSTSQGVSSDSSEGSDFEQVELSLSSRQRKKKSVPPINPHRSIEELEQYRRHFNPETKQNDDDDFVKMCQRVDADYWTRPKIYEFFARRTRSIIGFKLIPCPDWINASGNIVVEAFYLKDRNVCRSKLMNTLKRVLNPNSYRPEVIYDLDSLLLSSEENKSIRMIDLEVISSQQVKSDQSIPLEFESRFESGNLRRAMRVGTHEYDLMLNADVNSSGRQQWFYFRISGEGLCSSVTYTFNIINLEKQRTLFHQGMQPVVFSVKRYLASGQPIWERDGTSMCYYRNGFQKNPSDQTSYWSLSFDLRCSYDNDVLYVAYHYPYTYSQLMTDIVTWRKESSRSNIGRLRITNLCYSPCGNLVPLLLIDYNGNAKSCCVFMSRVHPCESNSSWSMRGLVSTALQDLPQSDEKQHPLVILPMLNVDGTVHGCSRTELSNEDLNRRWLKPDLNRHPTIYHAKGLLEYLSRAIETKPSLLVDFHGHSRRLAAFIYGCIGSQSWHQADRYTAESTSRPSMTQTCNNDSVTNSLMPEFVQLLQSELPQFDGEQCCFVIEKNRESTARIVGWRHLGISNSYTLEMSLAGSNRHPQQSLQHFNTANYLEVGSALIKVIKRMRDDDN